MAIKHYAGLDTNYLPTDGSVPVALGSEAVELTVASGRVSQAVSLEGYDKIAFVTEGDTNTSIDFLEILGNESTDATLEIVKDINASSGYALKMTGIQKLVFGTRISYVPDILKKITLKAKKDSGNTGNLYASVVSYANGQYINKLENISVEDYVSVVDTSSLTDSYTTNIGYIKGVGTSFVEPASNPNSPSELPSTTDEIALILEATGASDIYYIDVISLEEVENTIRDIPDGQGVYDSSQNFNTRNDRITTTPANPVVTTPSTYTLNGDGSIDITFEWTYTGSGDAYNIDGFSIYTYSSDNSTPPVFTDNAVYVDAATRKFTLYGITINKYYTIGVQAYRSIDHDVAVDLALSEDIVRSAIVQSTPYRPVNITPSTTSYAIQRNVGSYLGSESLGSIYIHGYYPNGMRGDIAGQILYNEGSSDTDMYLAINAQVVDCTDFTYTADEEYKCYLVLNAGVVKPTIYDINTNTFVNDTETISTGVVIGHVIVEYTHSTVTYTVKDAFVYENAKLLSMAKTAKLEEAWKYLSEATDQSDWESKVSDLGIENSFTFLAAYNAFITNLKAENITAGTGNGTTGGFRFRAMSRENLALPYNETTNPSVFDVMYDNKKLFEVVATGIDAGDVIIGDYANGNGIKYDKSANKLSVNGTVEAGSVVPVSNVRNGLGQDGNNNNFSAFTYSTTPGFFPEGTNGSFEMVGTTRQDGLCDDFIQVDTTKAYTLDMWAKATNGLVTTNHYLFYACYDADKILIPYSAGGPYNYLIYGNLSTTWTKYSTVINGIADGDLPTKFRPGTMFIKVGCLFNYSEDAYHGLYIAGINLREATPFSVDGTAFQTANGKVKIYNDGTIYGVQSNFEESVVNGIKLYPVFGQSSVLPTTLTLKENIPYGSEVIVNVSVRFDVSGLNDFYVFPASGKLSSANLFEKIPITQFWAEMPRSLSFNRHAGAVILYDTGTDYTLKYEFSPYPTPHIDIVYDLANLPMTEASLTIYEVMISGFIGILPN